MKGQIDWGQDAYEDDHEAYITIVPYKSVGFYIGECSNIGEKLVREGRGIHIFSPDKRIDGFWAGDQLNGYARVIETNYIFKGYFKNNKRHGYGKERYSNGNNYEGEFDMDKR